MGKPILFVGSGATLDERIIQQMSGVGISEFTQGEFEQLGQFGNQETRIMIADGVASNSRGKRAVFLQNYESGSVNDHIIETLIAAHMLKGVHAREVDVIMPAEYDTDFMTYLMRSVGVNNWYVPTEDGLKQVNLLENHFSIENMAAGLAPDDVADMVVVGGEHAPQVIQRIAQYIQDYYHEDVGTLALGADFEGESQRVALDSERLKELKGKDVFFVNRFFDPLTERNTNDHLVEALLFAYQAKKAGAARLVGVFPNMPYERQDKKQAREPESLAAVASMLELYDSLLLTSIHSAESMGSFRMPKDNISEIVLLYQMIVATQEQGTYNLLSVDAGGAKPNQEINRLLRADGYNSYIVIAGKNKQRSGEIALEDVYIIEDERLPGRVALLVDDMISSGSSIETLCDKIYSSKHQPDAIDVYAVSGFFDRNGLERMKKLHDAGRIRNVYIANTLAHDYEKMTAEYDFIHVFDIAPVLAQAVHTMNTNGSMSRLLTDIGDLEMIE